MPLLGNFAAQSNNNKKRDVPASPCFASPGCSTWFICPPVQAFFALFWDRQQSSHRCFVRSMPAHRTTTDEPALRQVCMFIGSFRQIIKRKEKPKRVPWGIRPPFDVCWWGFYRPELVESVKQSERTRGRGPATALFCFLNLKTMAGCRWKKKNSYKRDREKKMHGPLLILAFCRGGGGGGGGGRQEETSQSSARQKCGWLEVRSWRRKKASRFVSCSLDEIHHNKDSMTDLTRPGSLPCEELQSYPSSKRREKAKFVLPRKSGKIS